MNSPIVRGLSASLLVVSLTLAGCDSGSSGGGSSGSGAGSGSAGEVIALQAQSLDANQAGLAQLMRYRLRGVDNQIQESQAVVLIPAGEAPANGWPILAWGHGTTGVADSCAPSRTTNLYGYLPLINQFLDAGFAVVAPDFEGMGNEGSEHPYLHLDSAGRSMINAVKAAVSAYPQLGSQFASIGHSQGGHAALGAAELAHEVSPLSFVGAVAMAPASHLEDSARQFIATLEDTDALTEERIAAGTSWLGYAAYMLYGLQVSDSSFDLDSVYGEQGQLLKNQVESVCASELFSTLALSVAFLLQTQDDLESVLSSDLLDDAKVQAYISATEVGRREIEAPVLIVQGDDDTTVYPTYSQQLYSRLLNASVVAEYSEYQANHGSIVEESASDAIDWLTPLFE
ncbi:MAG: alpha/beta hydrolase family protein [Granulosicoccaceae bacterium]